MRLPLAVSGNLSNDLCVRWKDHFESDLSRDRTIEEGIWRRTQALTNANESGWSSIDDARRRIVYYRYKFGLDGTPAGTRLALTAVFVYQSLSLPSRDLDDFHRRADGALAEGGWRSSGRSIWARNDLTCSIRRYIRHPEDELAGRFLPHGYETLDITVESSRVEIPHERRRLPWDVLARGIRRRDTRGTPTVLRSLAALADFTPIQVEVGCGISTEAGIPPLHWLHDLYTVTDRRTETFIFGCRADNFLADFLRSPGPELRLRAQMTVACLKAEPTLAHRILKELANRRLLLAPIVTNNFDGLHARVGLEECYIRRYDEDVPDVPIYPETRALLVIGSHADRRRVQARMRERNIPIFFLDPEEFYENARVVSYPIEGAREGDYVRRTGATAGLLELAQELDLDVAR